MSANEPAKESLGEPTAATNVSQVNQPGKEDGAGNSGDPLVVPPKEYVSKNETEVPTSTGDHAEVTLPKLPTSAPATAADAAGPSTVAAAAAPATVAAKDVEEDLTATVADGLPASAAAPAPEVASLAEPKKRGRPPKQQVHVALPAVGDSAALASQPKGDAGGSSDPLPAAVAKKRGRPPKAGGGGATSGTEKVARPRGRPRKVTAGTEAAVAAGAGGAGTAASVPKKRGRPPKVGGSAKKAVGSTQPGPAKKRGRPKGSKNKIVKTKEKSGTKPVRGRGRPAKRQKVADEEGGSSPQPKGTVSLTRGRPALGKTGRKSKVVVGLLDSGRLTSEPNSGSKAQSEKLNAGKEKSGAEPKRRGRPPKAKDGVQKGKAVASTPGTGKRRGRPPGSGKAAAKGGERRKPGRPSKAKVADPGAGPSTAPVTGAGGGEAVVKKRGRPRKDSKPSPAAAVS